MKLQYLATWCEELIHWKRPLCWERLKEGREGGDSQWDGWMASPTWWTWVWASSGSWWWIGKPGMLLSNGVTKSWTWLSDWSELTESYLITGWQWQAISPWAEQRHFSIQSSRVAGSSRQIVEYDYNNKSKSEKHFLHEVQIGFLPATISSSVNTL